MHVLVIADFYSPVTTQDSTIAV